MDADEPLSIPVKDTTGRYYAPPEMLARLHDAGQVVLRSAPDANTNGSLDDIAGVVKEGRNVFGLMPIPSMPWIRAPARPTGSGCSPRSRWPQHERGPEQLAA